MSDFVYANYTQEELDAQYTNIASPEAEAAANAVRARAAANVEKLQPERGIAYGSDEDQCFDLYRAGDGAPAVIFFPGGQWQRGGRGAFCAWADACLDHGISFIDSGFRQIPKVRLPDIVADTMALVRHVRSHAAELGIDGTRLCIAGHSSGGHLAGATLVRLANEGDLDGIACGYLESGNYDLRPLMVSYRREYLQLSEAETHDLSPLLTLDAPLPTTLVVSGGAETDEFRRQSRTFCEALQQNGTDASLRIVPDANHFTVYNDLYEDGTPSWKFLQRRLGVAGHSAAAQ